ncbi:hypothetical protein ACU63U_12415 [Klebsiella aerogenes]|uniref:hypothetical protein n=1 Tax=Klebsiella TaxID=570 RepID=UPI00115BAC87|nr:MULTISPECIES: hypothetical protein [Klebsiella]QNC83320.1 hypothetical protein F3109_07290 [Klebsiella quasipneumoniae]HBV6657870.1 hypothetical protein [Klebsiella aerogenes]HEP0383905.1 hypothetical protein [Klebsiella aerogenes]
MDNPYLIKIRAKHGIVVSGNFLDADIPLVYVEGTDDVTVKRNVTFSSHTPYTFVDCQEVFAKLNRHFECSELAELIRETIHVKK